MNKTKFILLAAMVGIIALSCSLFEPATTVIREAEPEAYLAKMPWSYETFLFAVGDKRAYLYNSAGTEELGQIYFDGDGKVLTFDVNNEKKTASNKTATYDSKEQTLEYIANDNLNNYFDKDGTMIVRLDNINKGNVEIVTITSNNDRYRTNTTSYLFYWTLKVTNDTDTSTNTSTSSFVW